MTLKIKGIRASASRPKFCVLDLFFYDLVEYCNSHWLFFASTFFFDGAGATTLLSKLVLFLLLASSEAPFNALDLQKN